MSPDCMIGRITRRRALAVVAGALGAGVLGSFSDPRISPCSLREQKQIARTAQGLDLVTSAGSCFVRRWDIRGLLAAALLGAASYLAATES